MTEKKRNPFDYPVDEKVADLLRKLETSAPTKPGMYLHLYHGRTDNTQEMDDWGMEGPLFGPLRCVSVMYMDGIALCPMSTDDTEDSLLMAGLCTQLDGTILRDPMMVIDDMIFYDDTYYGEWAVEYIDGKETT